ncbi:rhomboid-domain-containing protein [Panus rudis PR-1116 ss-1]|nr:rhomboid-domain-containing protein [Panus rudis PR-1116 ss-1]
MSLSPGDLRLHSYYMHENGPESPILQFISNNVWRATHRDTRVQAGRARSSWGGPPPPKGPWHRFRSWIDSLPRGVILWGVLALNGAVFVAWHMAWSNYKAGRDISLVLWMRDNFTVSMNNIKSGRIWTLLTACFSHEDTTHIFFNAFTYYFMAPSVMSILGNSAFLALYLGGGLVSSAFSLMWHDYVRHSPGYTSHGASGAIYAIISFLACVAPKAQFLFFGVIPIPAWAFVTGVFLYDGYNAVVDKRNGTDTAGHIGGILAGIGYYLRLRFRLF